MSVFSLSPPKMGTTGIRNVLLIIEKPSCLPTNESFITLQAFTMREKWCLNNSLFPPPAFHSEREGLNQTEFVENIIFVSKELIQCEERTDNKKSQGNRTLRMKGLGTRHEVHFQFYQWPCVSHLSSWGLSLFICTFIIYGINVISQKWLWKISC